MKLLMVSSLGACPAITRHHRDMTFHRSCNINKADRMLVTRKGRLLSLVMFLKRSELLYEENTAIPESSWWGTAPPAPIEVPPLVVSTNADVDLLELLGKTSQTPSQF